MISGLIVRGVVRAPEGARTEGVDHSTAIWEFLVCSACGMICAVFIYQSVEIPPLLFGRGGCMSTGREAVLLLFLHLIPGILVEPPDAENHREKE